MAALLNGNNILHDDRVVHFVGKLRKVGKLCDVGLLRDVGQLCDVRVLHDVGKA